MMSRRSFLRACGIGAAGLALGGCSAPLLVGSAPAASSSPDRVTEETRLFDIIDNSLFDGFGRLLFPMGFREPMEDMTLADLPDILPWYS